MSPSAKSLMCLEYFLDNNCMGQLNTFSEALAADDILVCRMSSLLDLVFSWDDIMIHVKYIASVSSDNPCALGCCSYCLGQANSGDSNSN